MFYVKHKANDDVANINIKIDITDDNVYSTCPVCGKEFKVDIVEQIQFDKEFDLFSTYPYCPECNKKYLEAKKKSSSVADQSN
ncbi:MAG: hypothetical protein Q4D26_09140 [Clostridia bacterium]|nr:hypothetical protein [Clostridia bacterium]